MRDESFSDEQIALAQELHAAGLDRQWQPGDRLIGGERPVRVVRSVSIEGEPLVEVERGGRLQTVGVAHPRIWLPSVDDVLTLMGALGFEGALMFKGGRVAVKYRLSDTAGDYRIETGDNARTACYRVMLQVVREQPSAARAGDRAVAPSASAGTG